ncbi:hypothetical protein [Rhizorhapis sp.]|uniref:hypothetical protein n=1 Tax=Rhizorhapis sp. TaxID=1968842 RepID=UPI002B46827A|nr:hypothetical protein [Rhizorhapis sp.]HKR16725.1 hypothetical protein [Rhizorhapis sp.]
MGIFGKSPDAASPEPDRLREIAAEKVAAAERFSKAIAAAGEAMNALFDADRAFLAEYRQRHGSEAYSGSRLTHQFRGTLLQDLELGAPDLLRHLNQPRQSRAKAQTIANLIARQVENDLSSEPQPQPKEPVT